MPDDVTALIALRTRLDRKMRLHAARFEQLREYRDLLDAIIACPSDRNLRDLLRSRVQAQLDRISCTCSCSNDAAGGVEDR